MNTSFTSFSSSADAKDLLNKITTAQEEITLAQYNVFMGSAHTILKTKEALKEAKIDTDFVIFVENNYCKDEELLLVQDKDLKKTFLVQAGILKEGRVKM